MKNKKFVTDSRDKKLLYILGTVIAAFLVYQYGISPAWENYNSISIETDIINQQLAEAHLAIGSLAENKDLYNTTFKELTEKYKPFFYEINQESIIYYIDTLIANAGLKVESYGQSPTALETIPVYGGSRDILSYPLLDEGALINPRLIEKGGNNGANVTAENGQGQEDEVFDDSIPATQITLNFSQATYENITGFLHQVESKDRAIIVDGISIAKTKTRDGGEAGAGNLSGSISLRIYSLPKLDSAESNDLVFQPVLPMEKTNPFQ
jgi:hypothetical protein